VARFTSAGIPGKIALGMFLFILFGAIGYRLLIANGFARLRLAREEADKLFAHFRALTEASRNSNCTATAGECFFPTASRLRRKIFARHNVAAESRFILAQGWSQLLFFALLGLILFFAPGVANLSPRALTGYVVIALWLIGPLTGVLSVLSALDAQMWRWKKSSSWASRSPRTTARIFRSPDRKRKPCLSSLN